MRIYVRKAVGAGFGAVIALVAISAFAQGRPSLFGRGRRAVPEINGGNAATGAALVLGGAAVILSRRKRRSS